MNSTQQSSGSSWQDSYKSRTGNKSHQWVPAERTLNLPTGTNANVCLRRCCKSKSSSNQSFLSAALRSRSYQSSSY